MIKYIPSVALDGKGKVTGTGRPRGRPRGRPKCTIESSISMEQEDSFVVLTAPSFFKTFKPAAKPPPPLPPVPKEIETKEVEEVSIEMETLENCLHRFVQPEELAEGKMGYTRMDTEYHSAHPSLLSMSYLGWVCEDCDKRTVASKVFIHYFYDSHEYR